VNRYFRYIAEDDTGHAENSPLACKALTTLEFAAAGASQRIADRAASPVGLSGGKTASNMETVSFWKVGHSGCIRSSPTFATDYFVYLFAAN